MIEERIIGELPKGWRRYKVKDVCKEILGGGTPSTKKQEYWEGDIPWISSADIYGIKDLKPRRQITTDAIKNSATNILPKGGIIVVTRVGLGKLAVAPYDLCFSQDNQGLVLNQELISTGYALLVLQRAVQSFKEQSRGTTINGVTKKQLEELTLALPTLEEQNKIVSKIEELSSEIDKGVEEIKTAQQQLKVYRQAVLKWAFEGKLTNENVAERELPKGWKVKPLKEITTVLGDGLHGTPRYTVDGEYYFINGNNLSDGKIEIKGATKRVNAEEYNKYKKELNENSILVSINGTLGNTAFYNNEKVILGKSACYFNLTKEADKYFVRHLIASRTFLNYAIRTATGSTIPNVSLKAMRESEVPLPTVKEQQQIVQEIESRLSVCDKIEETITTSLKQAEALRQSILKKAFEGKLI